METILAERQEKGRENKWSEVDKQGRKGSTDNTTNKEEVNGERTVETAKTIHKLRDWREIGNIREGNKVTPKGESNEKIEGGNP